MKKQAKILVTGASGLIGSALVRLLRAEGYENLLTPTHKELDLRRQTRVFEYFESNLPDYVFHLAARVGGIQDNSDYPAEFCHDNTIMHCNVFRAASSGIVEKLLFPGSACAYPRDAEQPIKESSFLQGMPEPTNLAYALAKQNGIVMAQSFAKQCGLKVVLPMVTNTYGIGDKSSHVIPMLIDKFKQAKEIGESEVMIWGTGSVLRSFLHTDDVANAFLFLMKNYNSADIINVGSWEEISIRKLAQWIGIDKFGYTGKIWFDISKPDGIDRKVLDSHIINSIGWYPKISLYDGIMNL